MGIRRFAVLACVIGAAHISDSAAQDAVFKFEPTRKATAVSQVSLSAGDELVVSVSDLKDSEVLILQRCSDPCDTAKLIKQWRRRDFVKSDSKEITLQESGVYYFWIQRRLESGEVGPVFGDFETTDGGKLTLHFVSGTSLSIVLRPRAAKSH